MATKIFVNLPVKDLNKSKEFFTKLGFNINPQFTDEKAACVVISEDIYAMILTENFFKTFTKKDIADAGKSTEAIIALSADSKEKVNEMADKAIEAGGKQSLDPQDHGFMYQRSFQDLDGHLWEVVWMDPAAINQN
jgi:predicted lactoylglutathione lyase